MSINTSAARETQPVTGTSPESQATPASVPDVSRTARVAAVQRAPAPAPVPSGVSSSSADANRVFRRWVSGALILLVVTLAALLFEAGANVQVLP